MGLNEMQKKLRSDYLENNLIITECSQKKPFAFISYASDDWEIVFKQAVVPLQQQQGLCVYADKAFDKLNDKWIVPMLRNIRGSNLMIAFVSQNYIESYACFLELLTAVNNKKQVVFVDLGGELHLGDTTDQPNIERGVKNEILNQGANISTNTNNSSNDLMRAMKSSFTSITTLLQQDALSKYDISDAFINFFRDASINRKTINDLRALARTIKSVSSDVFEKPVAHNSRNQASYIPVESASLQGSQPEVSSVAQAPENLRPEASPTVQASENPQPEVSPVVQAQENPRPEVSPAADRRFDEPEQKAPAGSGARLRGKKSVPILIGAVAGLAVVILAFVLISSRSKHVEAMAYEYSMQEGNKTQMYAGVYTGEWKNHKPCKQGTFTYEDAENGFVYEGEWDKGLANGQGTMTFANGDVYEGEYLNGQRNGQGTATYAEDDKNGRRDYAGQWENGKRSGQGTMTWTNGDAYEGEWEDGQRNGQGTMTWISGDVYEGEWKDDSRNGQGTMTWSNGEVYEGEWKDGQRSGQGTLAYPEDDEHGRRSYEGQWENDKWNGQGTLTSADGVYEGEWKDGERNGQGTITLASGRIYEGEWKDGQRSGQGTMTYPEDDESGLSSYVGQWENDKPEGQGTLTYAENDQYKRRVYDGEWIDGKRTGQGTLTWMNGAVYEGEWKDGLRDGQGKYTDAEGTVYEGTWKEDKFVG